MKKPNIQKSIEDIKAIDGIENIMIKGIPWNKITDKPKYLCGKGDTLNNESISNGAGYQTAHQVNSAINAHSDSDNAHRNKINGKGITNIVVYESKNYKKIKPVSTTLYILTDTKEVYIGNIKLI